MIELTCVLCPNGCDIKVDGNEIRGNMCKKGIEFVNQEMQSPKRTLTSSIRTIFEDIPVVSCKTDKEIDRDLVLEAMKIIKETKLEKRYKSGEKVIENILNTGANVILTKDM